MSEHNASFDGGFLNLLSVTRFYISRWYGTQVTLFVALVVSSVACLVVFCWGVALHEQEFQLARERHGLPRPELTTRVHPTPTYTAVDLPPFSTSNVARTFNGIADEIHVPVDEVVYVFDSDANAPYRRYRITLTAKAAYPEVRKFVAVLASEMPNMALDSIRCTRSEVTAPTLGCELVFSAFFTKAERG